MKISDREILERIGDLARRHVEWQGEVRAEMRLAEDLSLDSLKLMTLAVEVENHFEICLDPARDHELVTLGDLTRAIRSQLEAAP